MAARFWVGGPGTWDNTSTAHWAASTGGASGASAPTSADTATFDTNSGLTNTQVVIIAATAACSSWTVTMSAIKSIYFNLSGNPTFTGAMNISGNSSSNKVIIQSDTPGTARTITSSSTTLTDVHFGNITAAGAGSWSGTRIGDLGGNTGITTTTPATQTWSGTLGGNWSANAWTSRVPLPQDDVNLGKAWSASQTITADVPYMGKNITWSGATGAPTWALNSLPYYVLGDLTLASGMTTSGTQTINLIGRTIQNVTTAGVTWTCAFTSFPGTTTMKLADAFISSNALNTGSGFLGGRFDDGGFSVTAASYTGGFAAVTTAGATTWTLTSTAAVTIFSEGATFNVVNMESATILISNASSATRIFSGGSYRYGTLDYTVNGSTGTLQIVGNNKFSRINFTDATNARTLQFTSGSINTIYYRNFVGSSGKTMAINAITGGSAATLISPGAWYMGANSTNVSGNSGLIFAAGAEMDWLSVKDITGQSTSSVLKEISNIENNPNEVAFQAINRSGTY